MPLKFEHCFEFKPHKWIYVPTTESKRKGKLITCELYNYWHPPEYFFHMQSGGHLAALASHKENTFYARLDIKNFFTSVTRNKIVSSLKKVGFPYKKAKVFADESTVKSKEPPYKHALPFGFVQSSALASVALDKCAFGDYISKNIPHIQTTVYADDVIFSSNDAPHLEAVYQTACERLVDSNFDINETKSHSVKKSSLAFNIKFSKGSSAIEGSRYSKFEEGFQKLNAHQQKSIIYYIKQVNHEQAERLETLLESIGE